MNSLNYLSRQYDVLVSTSYTSSTSKSTLKSRKGRRKEVPPINSLRLALGVWTWVHAQWVVWVHVRKLVTSPDLDDDTAVEEEEDDEQQQGIPDETEDTTTDSQTEKPRKKKKSVRKKNSTLVNPRASVDDDITPLSSLNSLDTPKLDLTPPTPHSAPLPLPQTLRLNPYANSLLTTHPQPRSKFTLIPSHQHSPSNSRSSTPKPQSLTRFHPPKTLVLDLDETLIHSTSKPPAAYQTSGQGIFSAGGLGFGMMGFGAGMWGGGRRGGNPGPAHMVEVVLGGRSTLYHVYKRPFVDYFLRKVSTLASPPRKLKKAKQKMTFPFT